MTLTQEELDVVKQVGAWMAIAFGALCGSWLVGFFVIGPLVALAKGIG